MYVMPNLEINKTSEHHDKRTTYLHVRPQMYFLKRCGGSGPISITLKFCFGTWLWLSLNNVLRFVPCMLCIQSSLINHTDSSYRCHLLEPWSRHSPPNIMRCIPDWWFLTQTTFDTFCCNHDLLIKTSAKSLLNGQRHLLVVCTILMCGNHFSFSPSHCCCQSSIHFHKMISYKSTSHEKTQIERDVFRNPASHEL